MESQNYYPYILNSLTEEIVFVDIGHTIRYVNIADKQYYTKFGELAGKSIFACHNPQSNQNIGDFFKNWKKGEMKRYIRKTRSE